MLPILLFAAAAALTFSRETPVRIAGILSARCAAWGMFAAYHLWQAAATLALMTAGAQIAPRLFRGASWQRPG